MTNIQILREGISLGQEVETASDAVLNSILARGDDDLKVMQRMDRDFEVSCLVVEVCP